MWTNADAKLKDGSYTKEQANRVKEYAHDKAEEIRAKYGYSGGSSGSDYVPVLHDGGIVGGKSFSGMGMDGIMSQLSANETPAILQNGEAVLTERQQSEISESNSNSNLNIQINNVNLGEDYDDVDEFSKALATSVKKNMGINGIPNIKFK